MRKEKSGICIVDKEYTKGQKNRRKATVKARYDNLQEYRNWLLEITICDPACGSGAFLNQALEFLISEHAYIDELQANLLESSIVFQDVCNHLLEENIFGVDINEESVDIVKLSLWLRTAQRGRKLTSLNNNIKCGNSLIDDPEVAGEKAFNWQNEFPQVFEKGGFDMVIGNPPYLAGREWSEELSSQRPYFMLNYLCMTDQYDLYALFIQKCYDLIKNNGEFSFIVPYTWFNNEHYTKLREWVLNNYKIELIGDYKNINVFLDVTVLTVVFVFNKGVDKKEGDEIIINTFEEPTVFKILQKT